MAPATNDDPHVTPADNPAREEQQVMSPSGAAAAARQQQQSVMPNGVARTSWPDGADEEYHRALATGGLLGATGTPDAEGQPALEGARGQTQTQAASNSNGSQRDVGSAGSADVFTTAATAMRPEPEGNRPILPHAALETSRSASNPGPWWPSPFPSPLSSTTRTGEVANQSSHGRNLAQSGAAAVRWFSRIGEYMRQATMVSRSRPGIEATVVQETVWSPGGTHVRTGEEPPLFDRVQSRRLQEMTAQAPQLYGPRPQTGAASDTSGSYSKEQVEAEVKRQVELALGAQRGLAEENQRLRLQVERLSSEVTARGEIETQASVQRSGNMELMRREGSEERKKTRMVGPGLPEGNPPGLSGHGREQGGLPKDLRHENLPGGNPRGLSGHEGTGEGDVLTGSGVPESNPPGLSGHGREQGGLVAEIDGRQPFQRSAASTQGVGGVKFGGSPIHLDFQETVMDLSGGMIEKIIFLEAIQPDFRDTDVSKGVVLFFSMHRVPLGPFLVSMHRVPRVLPQPIHLVSGVSAAHHRLSDNKVLPF